MIDWYDDERSHKGVALAHRPLEPGPMLSREDVRKIRSSIMTGVGAFSSRDDADEDYQEAYWDIRRSVDTDCSDRDDWSSSGYWTTDDDESGQEAAERHDKAS
jgi:hypothetical protein